MRTVPRRRVLAAMAALAGWPIVSARGKVVQITIDQLVFSPASVTVRVGDTVEWVNKDVVVHTATTKNKGWDVVIPAEKKARLVVKTEGAVDYYCRYHPTMTARLVVEPR